MTLPSSCCCTPLNKYCLRCQCHSLMNAVDDAIVQQLLFVVVQGEVQVSVPQPGVLPNLLQGVVFQ